MEQQTCPGQQRIADYLLGLLDEDESEEVARHIASCSDCEALAAELESADDDFVQLLRRPDPEDGFLDEPEAHNAVARAGTIQTRDISQPDHPTKGGTPASDTSVDPMPHQLGEYEIIEPIGKGGMGAVYKARHTKLKRTVAVKVLPSRSSGDEQAIQRFEA